MSVSEGTFKIGYFDIADIFDEAYSLGLELLYQSDSNFVDRTYKIHHFISSCTVNIQEDRNHAEVHSY